MDPVVEAMQDYFNCYHCPTSPILRKGVADSLFNVLTPETVNRLYRIRTTIGDRDYSPLHVATQTQNTLLAKRLLVELGADILLSEGEHGLHPLRSLLTAYANVTYWGPDRSQPVCYDTLVDVMAVGLARVKDATRLPEAFDHAIRLSGITPTCRTTLLQKLQPAIRTVIREAAWNRRNHLIPVYAMRLEG